MHQRVANCPPWSPLASPIVPERQQPARVARLMAVDDVRTSDGPRYSCYCCCSSSLLCRRQWWRQAFAIRVYCCLALLSNSEERQNDVDLPGACQRIRSAHHRSSDVEQTHWNAIAMWMTMWHGPCRTVSQGVIVSRWKDSGAKWSANPTPVTHTSRHVISVLCVVSRHHRFQDVTPRHLQLLQPQSSTVSRCLCGRRGLCRLHGLSLVYSHSSNCDDRLQRRPHAPCIHYRADIARNDKIFVNTENNKVIRVSIIASTVFICLFFCFNQLFFLIH